MSRTPHHSLSNRLILFLILGLPALLLAEPGEEKIPLPFPEADVLELPERPPSLQVTVGTRPTESGSMPVYLFRGALNLELLTLENYMIAGRRNPGSSLTLQDMSRPDVQLDFIVLSKGDFPDGLKPENLRAYLNYVVLRHFPGYEMTIQFGPEDKLSRKAFAYGGRRPGVLEYTLRNTKTGHVRAFFEYLTQVDDQWLLVRLHGTPSVMPYFKDNLNRMLGTAVFTD